MTRIMHHDWLISCQIAGLGEDMIKIIMGKTLIHSELRVRFYHVLWLIYWIILLEMYHMINTEPRLTNPVPGHITGTYVSRLPSLSRCILSMRFALVNCACKSCLTKCWSHPSQLCTLIARFYAHCESTQFPMTWPTGPLTMSLSASWFLGPRPFLVENLCGLSIDTSSHIYSMTH